MHGEWIRRPAGSACIVFVHGILSSGAECWKHPNGSYWPAILAAEPSLQALGIHVFTYYTDPFSGSYRLGDVVDALKVQLRLDGASDCKQLFFVCHSMGGIVVRRLIVERQSDLIAGSVQIGLFLVASPSLGAGYANWLGPLARLMKHSQADALRFSESNAWLNDLDKEFLNLKESHRLAIFGCELVEDKFIALKRLVWLPKVVPPFTGARYFGESFKVPLSDHFSIAKPDSSAAVQHRLLCQFLTETLAKMQAASKDAVIDGITAHSVVHGQALAQLLKSSMAVLVAQHDPDALDALDVVLDEISKMYQLIDAELTQFLSLSLDDDRQVALDRQVLLELDGALITARASEARGHCRKISRIYFGRLQDWFRTRLAADDFGAIERAFGALASSDADMAYAIQLLAGWLAKRASQTLDLVDRGELAAARALVKASRLDCQAMRQKVAATISTMRDLQADMIGVAV